MNEPFPEDLNRELLDDFHSECEELFGQIRAQLALLDARLENASAPVESLYRAVHTFKGNCGIVGLRTAERLAHAAEDLLRRFTQTHARPPEHALTLLARVLDRLERIVVAHRLAQTPPGTDDLLEALKVTSSAAVPPTAAPPTTLPTNDEDGATSEEDLPPGSAQSIAPSHIVRVDLSRLDDLMRIMGEMVIHRSRLEERISRLTEGRDELQQTSLAITRSLRDLREAITRVRMVPVAEIFARLPFALRELAQEQGKAVRLAIKGQDREIDKYLVERLKEPLLHLVRNAVSHGLETTVERVTANKSPEGTLTLSATTNGHAVVLTIEDDGRGIESARIVARARELGHSAPDAPTEPELLALLCRPGFSTRAEADLAAGRGMGMDVVHTTVRELGGVMTLETEPGRRTRFTLRLPLTLSIIDTLVVGVGEQTCAVPRALVEEIVQFEETEVRLVSRTEVVPYRGGLLPLVRLDRFLRVAARARTRLPALIVASERGLAGLVVDRVFSHREVVVRPMSDPLLRVPGIVGATELGDGRPVLILDPGVLTTEALRTRLGRPSPTPADS